MTTTVHDVIEMPSMAAYLQLDPLYAEKLSRVWLWSEWPCRDGKSAEVSQIVAYSPVTAGGHTTLTDPFQPLHLPPAGAQCGPDASTAPVADPRRLAFFRRPRRTSGGQGRAPLISARLLAHLARQP